MNNRSITTPLLPDARIRVAYTYRTVDEQHGPAIYALYRAVMREFIAEIWGWDEAWQQRDFATHFDRDAITGVFDSEILIGYSQVENRDKALFVRMLVLHSDYRRQGIGRELMGRVISATTARSPDVELEVFKINRGALYFYRQLGFSVVDETATSFVMAY